MSAQRDLQRALDNFRRAQKEVVKYTEDLPRQIGIAAIQWIHDNFERQGYEGKSWEPRDPKTNASYDKRHGVKGSVFNSANPILRQTNNLYDAIRKQVMSRSVFIGFDTNKVPYGKIHNEGGKIQKSAGFKAIYFAGGRFAKEGTGEGRIAMTSAHEVEMPQRQFMPVPGEPENPAIMKAVVQKLQRKVNRIMRIFEK